MAFTTDQLEHQLNLLTNATCTNPLTGNQLAAILSNILESYYNKLSDSVVEAGADNCVAVTVAPPATDSDPYVVTADVVIDPDPDNVLSCSPTGLFVPSASGGLCVFTVEAGTTDVIGDDANGSETVMCGDTIHFWSPDGTVNVTVDPGSAILGLDATITINANDTDECVDMTVSGSGTAGDPFLVGAAIIIDAAPSNDITCTVDGLYAPHETTTSWDVQTGGVDPVLRYTDEDGANLDIQLEGTNNTTVTETGGDTITIDTDIVINASDIDECVDMTVTGSGTAGDPFLISAAIIIDAAPGNDITCSVDGLHAPHETTTVWGVQAGGPDPVLRFTDEDGGTSDVQFLGGDKATVNEAGGVITFASTGNTSIVTDTVSGHLILNHDDGTGLVVPVNETITSWAVQTGGADPVLRYRNEDGGFDDIQLIGGPNVTITESDDEITFESTGEVTILVHSSIPPGCIDMSVSGVGTVGDPYLIGADIILDPDPTNDLVCTGPGLYAPHETTTSWGVQTGGVDPVLRFTDEDGGTSDIQFSAGANVSINESSGEIVISSLGSGGGGGSTIINELNTDCIEMSVTGVGTVGDPYLISASPTLDPAPTNDLVCSATGLLSPHETTTSWAVSTPGASPTVRFTDEDSGTSDIRFLAGTNMAIVESAGTITFTSSGGGGGSETYVEVLDTECMDMTISGDGDIGTPYIIEADPIIPVGPFGTYDNYNLLSCDTGLKVQCGEDTAFDGCDPDTIEQTDDGIYFYGDGTGIPEFPDGLILICNGAKKVFRSNVVANPGAPIYFTVGGQDTGSGNPLVEDSGLEGQPGVVIPDYMIIDRVIGTLGTVAGDGNTTVDFQTQMPTGEDNPNATTLGDTIPADVRQWDAPEFTEKIMLPGQIVVEAVTNVGVGNPSQLTYMAYGRVLSALDCSIFPCASLDNPPPILTGVISGATDPSWDGPYTFYMTAECTWHSPEGIVMTVNGDIYIEFPVGGSYPAYCWHLTPFAGTDLDSVAVPGDCAGSGTMTLNVP